MALTTAEGVKKELQNVVKYSNSDAEKAIAAGVLSLVMGMRDLSSRLLAIEKKLGEGRASPDL